MTFFTMINHLHHARDHLLLCICNSGQRSLAAASLLRSLGYPKALSLPVDVAHVIPKWGFMMSFGFLTANQRPYMVDMSPQSLSHQAELGKKLRLFYWKPEDAAKYRDLLESSGLKVPEVGTYFERDQQPAFVLMQAARN